MARQTTTATAADMTTGREAELRRILEERRQELADDLRERVRSVRTRGDSAGAGDVVDTAEWAEADIQDELHFSLMQMKAEALDRIDEALVRLDSGRFGQCVECEDEIPERRLRAMPFALRCTDCEDARERRQRQAQSLPRRFPGAMLDAN